MSSSTLFLLTTALLFQSSFGAFPLAYICSKPDNFTSNTPFESNLKTLFTFLDSQTPLTGFANASFGQYPNQQAFGLSLCRGDLSSSDCKTCVSEATTELLKQCPYQKDAIIWYDFCMIRYSDQDFFGLIDDAHASSSWMVQNASDPEAFNFKTKELLSRLAQEAHASPKMYAAGELKLKVEESKNTTVYGLTQCTRDLSKDDCKKCLDGAFAKISDCCAGIDNAKVMRGSCNVRYATYPFFNQ